MNEPVENEYSEESLNFDEMSVKSPFRSITAFLIRSLAIIFLLITLSVVNIFLKEQFQSIPWMKGGILILFVFWFVDTLMNFLHIFFFRRDIGLNLLNKHYLSPHYFDLMDRLLIARLRRQGWSQAQKPDLLEHIDEIMTTSRIAAERTGSRYKKTEKLFRWLWGASTCFDLMPFDYEKNARSEIDRNDEEALLEDWSSAFGPLASALTTRENDLKKWGNKP